MDEQSLVITNDIVYQLHSNNIIGMLLSGNEWMEPCTLTLTSGTATSNSLPC